MHQSLKRENIQVVVLGPVPPPVFLISFIKLITVIITLFSHKKYNADSNILMSLYYAFVFSRKLKKHDLDAIFAPIASTEIAFLRTKVPLCYLSDSSFAQLKDYYEKYSGLSSFSEMESDLIEKRALKKAKMVVYPSEWAADFVVRNYKIDEKKIEIIKFGANIDNPLFTIDLKKRTNPFKLLFVAVDWERKGGNLVFETLLILLERGYDVELTVCGCIPPVMHDKMRVIPFLDKNNADESKAFVELLNSSYLLFVPTRAECYGIVFCEAAACGLPSVTTKTGGVASVVEDGVNGYALPFEAGADKYAELIIHLIVNKELYSALSISAKEKYAKELSWDSWAKSIKEILTRMI
jgi:glycosyltransferase involved in cell wall biosynthesis